MKELLTTKEVAAIVGLSDARIRQLILAGILPAEKFGKSNLIRRKNLIHLEGRESGKHRKAA
jgi:excisionase family DNA binding protein